MTSGPSRAEPLGSFLSTNRQWLAAGALLTLLSSFGQTFFISIFAGQIQDEFGLTHGSWGAIYALGTTVSAVVMLWAGGLTDQFRARSLGMGVLTLLALSCLAMAVNPYAVLLPLVIFALRLMGQGMTSHIAIVAMARWFVATRGRALAIATLGFSLGEAILPMVFVSMMTVLDWRLLWVIAAGIALAGVPALGRLLREERTPQSMATQDQSTGMSGRHWTRREALTHPLFWFMVPALVGLSAFGTAFFFQQAHYAEVNGWSHLSLVALFPIYTAVGIGAMVLSGFALDRFGTARLIPFYQTPIIAAFLCFAWADQLTLVALGLVFFAITSGANATFPNAFWAEFYGTRFIGSIKAMAAAAMVLGSAIGPLITGVLIDFGVALNTQYIGVAVYFAGASLSMWIGVSRARRSLSLAT
ncbi:MFS transporter [Tateyamaria omphalii]|uniref:MFS transporter n=1 Tax=Tateyamaria omphalii TaxID=299262 RepID=UPI001C997A43|nr:MFS transporter [Tateyamaria omphalii]MBY5933412.1 MFS transporter [Tateyamaria omphalii]